MSEGQYRRHDDGTYTRDPVTGRYGRATADTDEDDCCCEVINCGDLAGNTYTASFTASGSIGGVAFTNVPVTLVLTPHSGSTSIAAAWSSLIIADGIPLCDGFSTFIFCIACIQEAEGLLKNFVYGMGSVCIGCGCDGCGDGENLCGEIGPGPNNDSPIGTWSTIGSGASGVGPPVCPPPRNIITLTSDTIIT